MSILAARDRPKIAIPVNLRQPVAVLQRSKPCRFNGHSLTLKSRAAQDKPRPIGRGVFDPLTRLGFLAIPSSACLLLFRSPRRLAVPDRRDRSLRDRIGTSECELVFAGWHEKSRGRRSPAFLPVRGLRGEWNLLLLRRRLKRAGRQVVLVPVASRFDKPRHWSLHEGPAVRRRADSDRGHISCERNASHGLCVRRDRTRLERPLASSLVHDFSCMRAPRPPR
jgi:hypothetical protein